MARLNWDDESYRIHMEGFIREQGLDVEWQAYKEACAEEEMDDSEPGWDKAPNESGSV